MSAEKRRILLYDFLKMTVGGLICRFFAFRPPVRVSIGGPALIVANHNTDLDPVFVGMSFTDRMTFVASEHVFRAGFVSKLLTAAFDPISRSKGSTDALAALSILRRLKRSESVCLFAEGNRSFNGVTGPVFPATGKLAKASRASLVTYRFSGSYLTTPRWGKGIRRGGISGEVVNIYSPDQLRKMTDDEINAAIAADLHEDAFERQKTEKRMYRGRRLAEGLEYALYICPKCGRVGTLKSEGDRFFCSCGLSVTYDVYGLFVGEEVPFENVRDWDAWQSEQLEKIAKTSLQQPEKTVFSDPDQKLYRLGDNHSVTLVTEGTLAISAATLSVGDVQFPLADIADMALCGRARIVFSVGAEQYEINNKPPCCGRKYESLLRKLKQQA